MPGQLYNNVTDTLSAPLGPTETTLSVTDGSKFTNPPSGDYFPLYIIASNGAHEIVHVTAVIGDDLTVERAQEGTDPLTFSGGETVQIRPTRQSLRELSILATSSTGPNQPIRQALDKRIIYLHSIAELRSLDTSKLADGQIVSLASYHAPAFPLSKLKGGGLFVYDASATTVDDGGSVIEGVGAGRFYRQYDRLHVYHFGVIGDYNTDDTDSLENAINAAGSKGERLDFDGVIKITRSIELPEFIAWEGGRCGYFNTWLNAIGNKPLLRPGYKNLMSGTNIVFSGDPSDYAEYTTNRSDQYSAFTFGFAHRFVQGGNISGIAFVQDMDVYDASGNLTNAVDDNRMPLGCAFVNRGQHFTFRDCNFFGYWTHAGRIIHSQQSLENIDSDYNRDFNVMHTSIALIAGDESDPDNGLTGYFSSGCLFHNAADHHVWEDGDYTRRAIYVDGNNGVNGSRGHRFDGSIRTRANIAIELDHCDTTEFAFATSETPPVAGITGADTQGQIIGSVNTNNVRWSLVGRSVVTAFDLKSLASMISPNGSVISIGGNNANEIVVYGPGEGFLRIRHSGEDSVIQMCKSSESDDLNAGWTLRRDDSISDEFQFRYGGASRLQLSTNGDMRVRGNLTVDGTINGV